LPSTEYDYAETLTGPAKTAVPGPATSSFDNGSVIAGKYRVERQIAEGGNGIVVEATHLALRQPVAIKYLKPGPQASPSVVDRFEREGRLAAQLTSEHVVRVHDVGELDDGSPFMVMELLKGRDLGRVLEESGPLPIPRAVDYVLQTCDALAQVHALEIVHRDIKPENLILAERASNTPIIKVIDFGISKAAPGRDRDGHWARETSKNDRLGTPGYMSPEQLRSSTEVDARTDIWSLGVMLHELLTQALPFEGDDLPQLCTNILLLSPVKLRAIRPGAPPEIEAIILKCLEKSPAHRFRNVGELAQDLAPFGPAGSQERADRIKDVLRMSGVSIRPAAPRPGSLDAVAIRGLAAPSLDAAEWRPPRRGRAAIFFVAVALGIAALATMVSLRRGAPSAPSTAFRPTAAPALEASRPAPSAFTPAAPAFAPAAVVVVTTSAPALGSPPPRVSPASIQASSMATPSTKKPALAVTHPGGSGPLAQSKRPPVTPAAATPPPTTPPPTTDPRALFGERK
jgi:eukaryotic-like serine/threonine-protein kinase